MEAILVTDDGSPTLISSRFGELYHSRRGAVTESLHVFLQEGFDVATPGKSSVRVGEIGLGSGLNALLTAYRAEEREVRVNYHAIEAYPPEKEALHLLHFGEWSRNREWQASIGQTPEDREVQVNAFFSFSWTKAKWPEVNPFRGLDVLYYDAFAPACQPELWNQEALRAAWEALSPGGILVTYCAKGSVKRDLRSVGFVVESPAGAPGKREMTRAIKRQ